MGSSYIYITRVVPSRIDPNVILGIISVVSGATERKCYKITGRVNQISPQIEYCIVLRAEFLGQFPVL